MTAADVLDVEPGAVESAVRGDRAEDFADRLQPAFPGRLGGLHHEGRRPHAEDHPVPAPVERCGGLLHDVVCGGRPGRQESRRQPGQQRIGAGVVGGHHDHPATAAGPDPVLGERGRLGGARARGIDLRVRPARADDLGELRMAHRQAPEYEAPVEHVRVGLDGVAQLVDAPVSLRRGRFVAAHPGAHRLQRGQLLPVACGRCSSARGHGRSCRSRGRRRRR